MSSSFTREQSQISTGSAAEHSPAPDAVTSNASAAFLVGLFSSDKAASSSAWEQFVAVMTTDKARETMEDIDEYATQLIEDSTHEQEKADSLKMLGNCWVLAVWLGIGKHYPDNFDKLLQTVAKPMRPSQKGLISSVKRISEYCGTDFLAAFHKRGVYLPVAPAKNLAEKLSAICKHRFLVSSFSVNPIMPGEQFRMLDESAKGFNDWIEDNFSSDELEAYDAQERPLSITDMTRYLEVLRGPRILLP
jgi:hypothetical protein